MRVAILFPGRIYGWQYCKESLKRLQEKYNATFFVSLNAESPDESSTEFCKYFGLAPDQIEYKLSNTPEKYIQYDMYRVRDYNFYSQWFQVRSAFDLLQKYSKNHNKEFDCIVKYRADIDSNDTLYLELPPQPNRLYCQVHHIFQTHDTIAYGDFDMMDKYSQLVNFYEYFYQNGMLRYGSERQHVKPTELLLFDYMCLLAGNVHPRVDIIYFDFKSRLHPKRHEIEDFVLHPKKVAILLPGRIYAWQYCKASLQRLQDKYNAVFFVSMNQENPDESSEAFCKYFLIGPDQIIYTLCETPQKYLIYDEFCNNKGINTHYRQWFHVKNAFDLMDTYCKKYSITFDIVVKYRADIDSPDILHLETPQPNRFYAQINPTYQTHDIIGYGDYQMMEKYSRLVDFFEYFYDNNMLMFGDKKQFVKPSELLLFDYLCLLAQTTQPRIDIIYFDFNYLLHPKRHIDEPFVLHPLLN